MAVNPWNICGTLYMQWTGHLKDKISCPGLEFGVITCSFMRMHNTKIHNTKIGSFTCMVLEFTYVCQGYVDNYISVTRVAFTYS